MGKLFVVGIGPGGPGGMTIAARRALEAADIVVGYTKYVELALAAVPDAAHLATSMMHEVERCRLALSRAQSGEAVALVCSGDAGVYGMASPVLELAEDYPDVDVEVIAGATAAQSGSAVLGAPLAHDFAVVSLSDLLTPWEVIERRLAAVASADFCICLYNPRSRKRADRLSRAAKIMLEWKAPDTLCGWVRNIGAAVGHVQALRAGGVRRRHVHHRVRRQRGHEARRRSYGHAARVSGDSMRKVTIIGSGPGNPDLLSRAALDAIDIADVVIGAHRALAGIDVPPDVVRYELVKTADIVAALTDAASWQRAVVVMTGDVGLFSGARRLVEALSGDAQVDVHVIPGISSASYLAARLARPWQDWRFVSAHGVACDIVAEAERAGELFLATSGGEDPSRLSGELVQGGFGDARVTVAERLSYPDERITCATASEIAGQTFDDLNVMLIEFAGCAGSPAGSSAASEAPAGASAPAAASSTADSAGASRAAISRWPYASSGIPDELFIRGDVPMTKQEVRAVALAKLRLTATDTVWDVGAGTGSVSIEAALVARAGSVWAVERNAAGVRLIRENADAFGCGNVHTVPGVAPEALAKLPVPDAVFVGGSAGELPSIVEAALEKNSQVRLCVPCVTVETLTEACALLSGSRFRGFEACQVSAARAEAVGSHHLMKAQNPVFLVSARGVGADAEELAEVGALAESPVGEDPSAEGNPSVEVFSLANCNAAGGEGGAR